MKTKLIKSPFEVGTGLGGYTEPGQEVTKENAHHLPAGSVVLLKDDSRLIHLHDDLWLWCCDGGWCYDRLQWLSWRLPGTLCHIPRGAKRKGRWVDEGDTTHLGTSHWQPLPPAPTESEAGK